jgi:hypothetical protein
MQPVHEIRAATLSATNSVEGWTRIGLLAGVFMLIAGYILGV